MIYRSYYLIDTYLSFVDTEFVEKINSKPTNLKDMTSNREIWTISSIILFISLSIFHLIISVLYYENMVWLIDWHSAVKISQGIPMYEQRGFFLYKGEEVWLPPEHFPVYFYFMALMIKIFGPRQFYGRIITWIFVVLAAFILIKIIKPQTEKELNLVNLLYFANPLLIMVNYIGKFDQITMFIMLLGMYLFLNNHYLFSGLILGIGVMTKLFPLFVIAAGGVYLLRNKQIWNLIKFSFTSIISILSIFMYFYSKHGEEFTEVLDYQINRLTPSLSVWYYILPEDLDGKSIIITQLIFFGIIGIFLLLLPLGKLESKDQFLFATTAFLTASYLVTTRQYYSSYAFFFLIPLIPILISLYRNGAMKLFYLGLSNLPVFFLGSALCDDRCYPPILPMTWFSYLGLILVFVSTLFILPYYVLLTKNPISN